MDKMMRHWMLWDVFAHVMGKEWCSSLRNNENLLIRRGYQIAFERGIYPIDVIQMLQVSLNVKHVEYENPERIDQTTAECLKYALTPNTLRRKLCDVAHRISKKSSLGVNEIMATLEEIGIEMVKEICKPKQDKVEAKAS
jgi:hypothetical protein